MPRSLRASSILASVLWTGGLLALMHMFFLTVIQVLPRIQGGHSVVAVVVGVMLMCAGLWELRRSLLPFRHLRQKLTKVRMGHERLVGGAYPVEVQPLIDELNALIQDREKAVSRAAATAGDLAHGLKTPLALLLREADRTESEGNSELADNIRQQVERMSRQVTYHLARARAAAFGSSGAAHCSVRSCAEALIRTVAKLYAERALDIVSMVSPDLLVRVHREDLEEMLGNLFDNACKWAKSKIVLQGSRVDTHLVLTVDDDGPGLPCDLRTIVLERGIRADEAAPGSGLGLAIVRDLAELYNGSISLEDSPLGGLRVRVLLPAN
jgi:signal transduction histidine kinase